QGRQASGEEGCQEDGTQVDPQGRQAPGEEGRGQASSGKKGGQEDCPPPGQEGRQATSQACEQEIGPGDHAGAADTDDLRKHPDTAVIRLLPRSPGGGEFFLVLHPTPGKAALILRKK